MEKELTTVANAAQMIEVYQRAKSQIFQALDLLHRSKQELKQVFGQSRDTVLPHRFSDFNLNSPPEVSMKEFEPELKKHFWGTVVEKTEFKKLLSVKRQEELDRSVHVDSRNLPEPNAENLWSFLQSNVGQAGKFVEEAIIEVFNFLRPSKYHRFNQFKTNDVVQIGDCVKIDGMVQIESYFSRLNSYRTKDLRSVDSLFHTLDNKPIQMYPGDLCTKIEDCLRNKSLNCETEYFRVKCFKKGSVHIYFKRMDLVAKINEVAGKNFLKETEK